MPKYCKHCGKKLGIQEGRSIPDFDLDSDLAYHLCDECYAKFKKTLKGSSKRK